MDSIDWYNNRRLHSWCGDVPPAEHEAAYYSGQNQAFFAGESFDHGDRRITAFAPAQSRLDTAHGQGTPRFGLSYAFEAADR
jgi:hypothetical protein